MFYVCRKCRYIFYRTQLAGFCPDCGSGRLRPATPEEETWYRKVRAEFGEMLPSGPAVDR